MLDKEANFKDLVSGAFSKAKDAGKYAYEKGRDGLYVAVPVTALAAAYMVSKLMSPDGVKENINDIVINANEKTNLAESIRDIERLKLRKQLSGTQKIHDQFI